MTRKKKGSKRPMMKDLRGYVQESTYGPAKNTSIGDPLHPTSDGKVVLGSSSVVSSSSSTSEAVAAAKTTTTQDETTIPSPLLDDGTTTQTDAFLSSSNSIMIGLPDHQTNTTTNQDKDNNNSNNNNNNNKNSTTTRDMRRINISRFESIVDQLLEVGFTESHLEQMIQHLEYQMMTSIDVALDWACQSLPTSDLPSILTDSHLREESYLKKPSNTTTTTTMTTIETSSSTTTTTTTAAGTSTHSADDDDDDDYTGLTETTIQLDSPSKQPNTTTSTATPNITSSINSDDVEKEIEEESNTTTTAPAIVESGLEEEIQSSSVPNTPDEPNIVLSSASSSTPLDATSGSDTILLSTVPSLLASSSSTTPAQTYHDPEFIKLEEELTYHKLELEQLQKEHQTLKEDLSNEANNYLRSKHEIKSLKNESQRLGTTVKKKQQMVIKLQHQVEKMRVSSSTRPNKVEVNSHDNDDEDREDEEEEGSGAFFDPFSNGDDDDDNQDAEDEDCHNESTTTTTNTVIGIPKQEEQQKEQQEQSMEASSSSTPSSLIDATIGKTWTGTTPLKALQDLCQKRKISRPIVTKLPHQQGYSMKISLPISKAKTQQKTTKMKKKEEISSSSTFMAYHHDFLPNSSLPDYLATKVLFELEPTMPLYHILPPSFRCLWTTWLQQVEDAKGEADVALKTAKQNRLEHLISLIPSHHVPESSFSASKTSQTTPKKNEELNEQYGSDTRNDPYHDVQDVASQPSSVQLERARQDFSRRVSTQAYQNLSKIRGSLPMAAFRDIILETVKSNRVTIISAQTGAGKTTQCPQFLLEDALLGDEGQQGGGEGRGGMDIQILVTQPRRVAAISVAERVSEEMCEPRLGGLVGYQIRMEAVRSPRTKLLFCTTGIILRRLQDDRILKGVTHIIVDEVHERQQQTDVLLIALRELLETTRPELKVILMSATLGSKLFCDFFGEAPLIEIPGRTYPVSSYFLEDCLDATGHVVEESSKYARRGLTPSTNKDTTGALWITNRGGDKYRKVVDMESSDLSPVSDMYQGYSMSTRRTMDRINEEVLNLDLLEDILTLILCYPEKNTTLLPPQDGSDSISVIPNGAVLVFLPGLGEIRAMTERLRGNHLFDSKKDHQSFDIIPMHSTLSSKDQKRAFLPSPKGTRKIILSTNIAETSVTIPDVVCVIDTGRVREIRRNKRTLTSVLETVWCSRASCKQRAGRAGRVQPGLCLKLFSRHTEYSVMQGASEPELRRVPLEEICLSILAGGFGTNSMTFLSKAPQPPDESSVLAALECLQDIGAIVVTQTGNSKSSSSSAQTRVETLTPLGRHLARLPVDVRLGKLLIFGSLFRCLDRALTIAASLSSSKSPFITTLNTEDMGMIKAKQSTFLSDDSDFETYCNVWEAYCAVLGGEGPSAARRFCQTYYLSYQALREIKDSRKQYLDLLCSIGFVDRTKIAGLGHTTTTTTTTTSLYNENGKNNIVLNAVLCAGLYPNIAHLLPTKDGIGYELYHKTERLHFHSSSVNGRKTKKHPIPAYLCFHEKFGSRQNYVSVSTTCTVHPYAIVLFGGGMIDVKHLERMVIIDRWIELSMAAQVGVMLKGLRNQVDEILKTHLLSTMTKKDHHRHPSSTEMDDNQEPKTNTNTTTAAVMIQGIVDLLSSKRLTREIFDSTVRLSQQEVQHSKCSL